MAYVFIEGTDMSTGISMSTSTESITIQESNYSNLLECYSQTKCHKNLKTQINNSKKRHTKTPNHKNKYALTMQVDYSCLFPNCPYV